MIVGIPKEIMLNEGRVAAIPETVRRMVEAGLTVLVQTGAGAGAYHTDQGYVEAGAEMVAEVRQLWERAEVVLKVKEPLEHPDFGCWEDELLAAGKTLITFLHPANSTETVLRLCKAGITGISMDCIPREKNARPMDALSSMSIVAGYRAVVLAANHLRQMFCGVESGGGKTTPARVLVIGCGMVGMQSIAGAKGLGAEVYAVDIRPEARQRAEKAGARAVGFDIPEMVAEAKGQAKLLSEELLEKERRRLAEILPEMEVVIPSILILGEHAPLLITRQMVGLMKPGSVIVDVSIDQGGNCELTERGRIITTSGGVTIAGLMNLPGQVPVHSAQLYAHNICNLLLDMWDGARLDLDRPIAKAATVTRGGEILHEGTLHELKVEHKL
ncbi:MAG: NAD(P)(+) transhydrogenase (Re/Si-specific) subunit alpha [Anaerolineaceae bacterium]|nr:NAD(P)(+) transhydrogenase (Re/Si-specific) subunit alpha [Anaerolineaceae bacterium]